MKDVPLEISAAEAKQLLWEAHPGEMLLLDCRTPDEHATARITGAVLVPMQELPERIGELEAWRARRIIVHCHHGVRSLRVTHWLRERGFPAVTSLRGGIDAWSTDVDPGVPRY
ncbi:MAG: rhodanese-like domain-containing protein [Planctomycetia bacterium]